MRRGTDYARGYDANDPPKMGEWVSVGKAGRAISPLGLVIGTFIVLGLVAGAYQVGFMAAASAQIEAQRARSLLNAVSKRKSAQAVDMPLFVCSPVRGPLAPGTQKWIEIVGIVANQVHVKDAELSFVEAGVANPEMAKASQIDWAPCTADKVGWKSIHLGFRIRVPDRPARSVQLIVHTGTDTIEPKPFPLLVTPDSNIEHLGFNVPAAEDAQR
jgi:hypothetical protein